jgi:hypothetical protein
MHAGHFTAHQSKQRRRQQQWRQQQHTLRAQAGWGPQAQQLHPWQRRARLAAA